MKELLHVQEAQLDKYHQELSTRSATTNVAQAVSNNFPGNNEVASGSYQHFYGRARAFRGRGCGRKVNTTCNRTTCQICNKYGHVVIDIYDEYFIS